jgi:hypothetical protein
MDLLEKLDGWFQRKPLIFVTFASGFEQTLRESSGRLNRFTWAISRAVAEELKVPTLCLVQLDEERSSLCVGVILAKAAVTTFDSRLTFIALQRLRSTTVENLSEGLGESQQSLLWRRIHSSANPANLTPGLSIALLRKLGHNPDDQRAVEKAAGNIPGLKRREDRDWEQLDAIRTAMAAFGITKTERPAYVEVTEDSDSVINGMDVEEARVYEDNVIARDASILPGLLLVEKDLTGHAVFLRGSERLDVYTANRGVLERMLGVDLIYINDTLGSVVMVQYKMLEPQTSFRGESTDWVAKYDKQFEKEVARMKLPEIIGVFDDYRIHRNPFFFKFVRRVGDGHLHQSYVLSLDHLNQILESDKGKGARGGLKVSSQNLEGVYLRDSDLISLIRSGYIGTHRKESDTVQPFITEAAKGNRAIVLAWQSMLEMKSQQRTHARTPEEAFS